MHFIAEQPAPAPHLAHPERCAALRIVLVSWPRVLAERCGVSHLSCLRGVGYHLSWPRAARYSRVIDSGFWEGWYHECRNCSRDTYPESCITQYTSIRRNPLSAMRGILQTAGHPSFSMLTTCRHNRTSDAKLLFSFKTLEPRVE